jgi:kinetochore protein Spc7/SPC105
MDNQFRNVKTHARLLSKAMWYEWRMKLLEGLKEGLDRHVSEMQADDVIFSQQEKILGCIVPGLVEKQAALESEATALQQMVDEVENCDQDELRSARERLAKVDAEIAAKRSTLDTMQKELHEKMEAASANAKLKDEYVAQIKDAERVKEECRGWNVKEVLGLKGEQSPLLGFDSTIDAVLNSYYSIGGVTRGFHWMVHRFRCSSFSLFRRTSVDHALS